MGELPSRYELNDPEPEDDAKPPKPSRISAVQTGLIIVFGVLALAAGSLGWYHAGQIGSSYGAQIHSQAREIRQLKTEMNRDAVSQTTRIAAVSARIPDAPDLSDLITCQQLKHVMAQTVTGVSVSAVPGQADVSEGTAPLSNLPKHCQ